MTAKFLIKKELIYINFWQFFSDSHLKNPLDDFTKGNKKGSTRLPFFIRRTKDGRIIRSPLS